MHVTTQSVAFEGIVAHPVEVQCIVSPGLPGFSIVGLPNKAVSEARDRVRSALEALSIALPAKRITVNLAPADMPKQGAHFDLPIALAVLGAINVLPTEDLPSIMSIGELSLDGRIKGTGGALPAALSAAEFGFDMLCAAEAAPEAAWVGDARIFGASTLLRMIRHLGGQELLHPTSEGKIVEEENVPVKDIASVIGQDKARRAIEIAVAGRHHMLMLGPPGCGKSLMAECARGLMPPMTPLEAFETATIKSIAGGTSKGGISHNRPFKEPHHSASDAAMIGGGKAAMPGQISLAHNGILFMDELPEFQRDVLKALLEPIETGKITVARANAEASYPCKFLLIAAANPCPCGHLADPAQACSRAPNCGERYLSRISGPLMDRFDIRLELASIESHEMDTCKPNESSDVVRKRILRAKEMQTERFQEVAELKNNADLGPDHLPQSIKAEKAALDLATQAYGKLKLSMRGYHRILKLSRTIADLAGEPRVKREHLAEALSFRLPGWRH